jgi:hypothetical protein
MGRSLSVAAQVDNTPFNVTNLTVTTGNLQVTFRNADVVGVLNLLTGEQYLRYV